MTMTNKLLTGIRQSVWALFVLVQVAPLAHLTRAQPSLISSQPPNGAGNVPVSASVVFVFDTPMEPDTAIHATDATPFAAGSILWSANIAPANFQNSWNEESTILTCNYLGDLPPGATITWKINTANALFKLGALEDFFPANPATGTFTTAGQSCDPDGIPDDYGGVVLFKGVTYLQTSAAAPVLKTDEAPSFFVSIDSPAANAVTGASLTGPPASTAIPLTGFGGAFFASEEYASQAAMDAARPDGSYAFSLTRQSGGPNQFQMQTPAATAYPPIPQVSNFAPAQAIDPTQSFTLNFNALTGASGSDAISIDIATSQGTPVLSAPDLCIPLPLANTATSFTIPANTLVANQAYTVRLTFSRTFYASTTNPQNFASFGALQRQTVLTITTGGGGGTQPQMNVIGFQSGFFAFEVTDLQPATNYRIQYSSTLQPNSWQLLQTLTTSTPMPITDLSSTPTTGRKYYRVITP